MLYNVYLNKLAVKAMHVTVVTFFRYTDDYYFLVHYYAANRLVSARTLLRLVHESRRARLYRFTMELGTLFPEKKYQHQLFY